MPKIKIISWNVNGIRASEKKGFFDFLKKESPDVLCLQETKAMKEQLSEELQNPQDYEVYYNSAQRKGYSGVATFVKKDSFFKAQKHFSGMNHKNSDHEGRIIETDFKEFTLFNIYFPNGQMGQDRLDFKMEFYKEFLKQMKKRIAAGEKIIVLGDYNTAHTEIDLARPKENEKISGFLPIERAWLDDFIAAGFVDGLRALHPEKKDYYSWWSMRTAARDRNIGWRIDYIFFTENLKKHLKTYYHLTDQMGSDHCPVVAEFEIGN